MENFTKKEDGMSMLKKLLKRQKLEYGTSYFDTIRSNNPSYLNMKKIVVSDCDGVLTDGNSTYNIDGKIQKTFGAYDTEMISFMQSEGWEFQFVSRDPSGIDITRARMYDMHSTLSVMSGQERADFVYELVNNGNYDVVLFVGDSLSDIQAMSVATYAACPNNAVDQCRFYVDFYSRLCGGHGALGDILMWIHNTLKNIKM